MKGRKAVINDFKQVHWAANREAVELKLNEFANNWHRTYPKLIEGGEANCPTRRSFLPHSVLKLTPLGERIDQEFQKWHR